MLKLKLKLEEFLHRDSSSRKSVGANIDANVSD
jgi:hypothetical protein